MSDTTQNRPSTPTRDKPRRRFLRRAAIATALAGIATVIGVKALAHAGGPWRHHHASFMGAPLDPARVDEHLDRMLKRLYVEIDATEAQRQQLAPIVKSAARDLVPVRQKIHEARHQAVELLSREHVDRAALEALRVDQLKLVEQASMRLTQALADVADVLTPEQKKQLAERIGRWHAHRG